MQHINTIVYWSYYDIFILKELISPLMNLITMTFIQKKGLVVVFCKLIHERNEFVGFFMEGK